MFCFYQISPGQWTERTVEWRRDWPQFKQDDLLTSWQIGAQSVFSPLLRISPWITSIPWQHFNIVPVVLFWAFSLCVAHNVIPLITLKYTWDKFESILNPLIHNPWNRDRSTNIDVWFDFFLVPRVLLVCWCCCWTLLPDWMGLLYCMIALHLLRLLHLVAP